jgi:hypothetical protein
MSGREGKCAGDYGYLGAGTVRRGTGGGDRLSVHMSPTGGKKKPLKQPKKQAKEMDEVRAGAEARAAAEGLGYRPGMNLFSPFVGR